MSCCHQHDRNPDGVDARAMSTYTWVISSGEDTAEVRKGDNRDRRTPSNAKAIDDSIEYKWLMKVPKTGLLPRGTPQFPYFGKNEEEMALVTKELTGTHWRVSVYALSFSPSFARTS